MNRRGAEAQRTNNNGLCASASLRFQTLMESWCRGVLAVSLVLVALCPKFGNRPVERLRLGDSKIHNLGYLPSRSAIPRPELQAPFPPPAVVTRYDAP